jgi:hypothetical protein
MKAIEYTANEFAIRNSELETNNCQFYLDESKLSPLCVEASMNIL